MNIVVLGAGAWGTALAIAASRNLRNTVSLWARDPEQAADMAAERENRRYLPGVGIPRAVAVLGCVQADLVGHLFTSDLIVVAVPVAGLRRMLTTLRDTAAPVAWVCKGFEHTADAAQPGLLPHEICAEVAPTLAAGALSGPSFAHEVALGQPTALVAASAKPAVCEALVHAFHGPALRVYANHDLVGVEVGGAVKNVMAIATGLCDGLQLGANARAALVTRGLAEMTRLGSALGARAETFMGLSGLGDLVLTATGDLSRNRKVGLMLAEGRTTAEAVRALGHVAEGVYCARTVVHRAQSLGISMPIAEAVVGVLDGTLRPPDAIAHLMERDAVPEPWHPEKRIEMDR